MLKETKGVMAQSSMWAGVVVTTGAPGDVETVRPASPPHLRFFSYVSPLLKPTKVSCFL